MRIPVECRLAARGEIAAVRKSGVKAQNFEAETTALASRQLARARASR